jgi:hypothetical protein
MAITTPHPRATPAAGARLTSAVQQLEGDRVLGIVGAVVVLVATGLNWYTQRVSVSVGGALEHVSTGYTLWHVRNVAAWLIVAAAAIGVIALLLSASREWRGGMVAATAGLGIMIYSLVALADLPALGSGAVVGLLGGASFATKVDVGPFVALLGGFLLLVGGLAASGDAAPMARPAS